MLFASQLVYSICLHYGMESKVKSLSSKSTVCVGVAMTGLLLFFPVELRPLLPIIPNSFQPIALPNKI